MEGHQGEAVGSTSQTTREEQAGEEGSTEESELDRLLGELSILARDALVANKCKICVTLDGDTYGLAVVLSNGWLIPIENIDSSEIRASMEPSVSSYERVYDVRLRFRDLSISVGKDIRK